MLARPAGFFSYVRRDDESQKGKISELREKLQSEIQIQTGDHDFQIFQDRKNIGWGQNWSDEINFTIDSGLVLFPVITPGFFKSLACREELERFIKREKELDRKDLVFPIYYISTPLVNSPGNDNLAKLIGSRQYADIREFRFEMNSAGFEKLIANLVARVVAIEETASRREKLQDIKEIDLEELEEWWRKDHTDVRLRQPLEMGKSLHEIAQSLSSELDKFDQEKGCTNNKFFDLGEHVYRSAALAINTVLKTTSTTMSQTAIAVSQDVAHRLIELSSMSLDYQKNNLFDEFWIQGRFISDDLIKEIG